MKIIDSKGNVITKPDYTKGRLLEGSDSETLVYWTWEEKPDLDENGDVIDHTPRPSYEDRMAAAEAAIVDLMLA
jgi:hypothetical protein